MIAMLNAGMGSHTDQEIEIYSRQHHLPHQWFECGTGIDTTWRWSQRLDEFCETRTDDRAVRQVGSLWWALVLCSRKYGGLTKAIEVGAFNIKQMLRMLSAIEKSPVEYHVFLQ
jgi:hypothetical protein